MKVLYLSVWYPSEKDKMAGLFVQKHAQAVAAQGAEVRVNTLWTKADLVQLNVLTLKMGMVAYVLKRVFGIPYIIVEHWSGYLPQNGQYERFPRWKRALLEEIAREASGIYPVSQMLEDNMKRCGIVNQKWGRVQNVVDDFFYEERAKDKEQGQRCRLLYVGCFDEKAKNVKGLLRAVKKVSEQRQDFRLTLVGTGKDWQLCRNYANELAIPDSMLRWTGEVSPQKVARYIQQSDVLLLPSNYETYGVPMAEAMAAGIPSIETDTCGLRLSEDCGVSIPPQNDKALVEAIVAILDHYAEYDANKIRIAGKRFASEIVGEDLMTIYKQTILH